MQDEIDRELDLVMLAKVIVRKLWVVILCTVIGASSFFAYTYFTISPTYKASVKMYVNNSSISVGSASFSISSGDISAAKSLVETYIVILQSRQVINDVISEANLSMTYDEVLKLISASPVNSTEVFEVTVTDTDPLRAELIANTIAEVLPEKLDHIVDGSSMRIVDYAVVPSEKSGPNISKNTLIGALFGMMASMAIIIINALLDTTIRDEEILLSTYKDIPVLAIIPDMNAEKEQASGYNSGRYSNQYITYHRGE